MLSKNEKKNGRSRKRIDAISKRNIYSNMSIVPKKNEKNNTQIELLFFFVICFAALAQKKVHRMPN